MSIKTFVIKANNFEKIKLQLAKLIDEFRGRSRQSEGVNYDMCTQLTHISFRFIDIFQIKVSMFPLILVTIGQIVKKWQQLLKFKTATATILKSALPVEPPSREINF